MPPPSLITVSAEWDPSAFLATTRPYPVTLNGARCTLQADECQLSFSNISPRNRQLKEVRRYWWREVSHLELCSKNRRLLYLHLLYAVVLLQNGPLYPVTVVRFASARARRVFVRECTEKLEVIRLVEDRTEEDEEEVVGEELDENGNAVRRRCKQSSKAKFEIQPSSSFFQLLISCLRCWCCCCCWGCWPPAGNAFYEPVLSKVFFCP